MLLLAKFKAEKTSQLDNAIKSKIKLILKHKKFGSIPTLHCVIFYCIHMLHKIIRLIS